MPRSKDAEQLPLVVPPGWREALRKAAGDETVSAFVRRAIRREYKRRTKRDLPGEVKVGRPKG